MDGLSPPSGTTAPRGAPISVPSATRGPANEPAGPHRRLTGLLVLDVRVDRDLDRLVSTLRLAPGGSPAVVTHAAIRCHSPASLSAVKWLPVIHVPTEDLLRPPEEEG